MGVTVGSLVIHNEVPYCSEFLCLKCFFCPILPSFCRSSPSPLHYQPPTTDQRYHSVPYHPLSLSPPPIPPTLPISVPTSSTNTRTTSHYFHPKSCGKYPSASECRWW